MKACTVFVASAVVAMASIDSVVGYAKFLDAIPNGSGFAKTLGHTDAGYTDFGTTFSKAGSWTADFCKATFPGTSMTNGAAFGDPCCTWKVGGTPDKTVTAFVKPTTATTCAAATPAVTPAAAPASTPAAAATTTAPAGKPSAPAAGATPAPAGKPAAPAAGATPAPAGKPAAPAAGATPAPAGKPSVPGPVPGGKPSKCKVKEEKSLDDEEEETTSDNDNNDSEEIPDY